MAKKKRKKIGQRTHEAQVAIDNALAIQGILNCVSAFGYNQKELTEGKALHDKVVALVNKQKAEYGDQFEATKELNDSWALSSDDYVDSVKVARVAFKKAPKAVATLGLAGERKETLGGFIQEATQFYDNLPTTPKLLGGMKKFGYTKAKVMAEKKLLNAVIRLNNKQEKEKGEAREATQKRDKMIDKLDAWMADFKEIAKIALADNPKWLDKLGFREDK